MATKTAKPDSAEIYAQVDEHVRTSGETRADAFDKIATELGMRAGTVAAHYYREARKKTRDADGSAAGPEPDPDDPALDQAADEPTLEQELPTTDPSRESFRDVRPQADGHTVETLHIAFGGGVDLDPIIQVDREFFAALKLGMRVTLTVECEVAAKGPRLQRDKDGVAHTTDTAKLRIDSFDITHT